MLRRIITGCKTIDKFLEGGIPTESVSLVYGEAETGKTTFAMQCAANCAKRGLKILYVDCDGTFSTRRLAQIASDRFEEIAELIILMRPNSFQEQATVTDQLSSYVTMNFGLVVFDSVTSLYRARIAEIPSKTFELNRELNRQLAILAQVAKTHKVAVIATSQVHSVLNETSVSLEPVATRVLKFWADIVIAMKITEKTATIKMILEKAPKKPQRTITCDLKIDESGIHEEIR